METLNWIATHWETMIGVIIIVSSLLGGLGSLIPDAWGGEWLRRAGLDVAWFVVKLREFGPKVPPSGPPAALLLLVALSALPMTGCAGSFEIAKVAGAQDRGVTRAQVSYGAGATAAPADPKRCQALDETHMVWSSFAKAGAALTGGAGLATIPADDQGARIGLAVGAVIVGAFTAAAITVADSSAESWSRECSAP